MKFKCLIILILLLTSTTVAQVNKLPPGDSPPPTVFDRVKDAGSADDFEDTDYIIVFDSTDVKINNDGVAFSDNYVLKKVLTEDGCKNNSVLTWGYEPMSSYVDVREVNIIRDSVRIPVAIDGVLDLPAPQAGIYWSDRMKMLQLPRLMVNDGIEIKVYRKGYSYALLEPGNTEPDDARYIPPMPGQYFDIVLFQANVPIVEKYYVLKTPPAKRLHSQIYNGPMYSATSYTKDTTIYSWWIKDASARPAEGFAADAPDVLTKVVIATVESWEAKSRWFFDVNESQFAYTDAIKAKVDEIFAKAGVSKGTEEQKAFELVHWVAQNIRYSGQTMGEGEGFTLHSGEMIFEQRSGVCKDIAGMLITMMRAADLDSYAAMTMAGSRIETVPADQFNHCVVALKKADGSFEMYDPTWVPNDRSIWSMFETEQNYLVGSPDGEGLSIIDYSPPAESPMHVRNTGRILPNGTLEATIEFEADGGMDYFLRNLLAWNPLSEIENSLSELLRHAGEQVEIISYEHGDISDFDKMMWWKIKYRIPDFAFMLDDAIEFRSPMMMITSNNRLLFRMAGYDWPEERKEDFFAYTTQLLDASETIKLPKGYKVADAKNSEVVDETYGYFKGTSDMKGSDLTVTQWGEIRRRQIPPDGYAGFRKAAVEAKEYAETVFRATKGGAK
jgi:Domain of Unknown Function with PDB structure (DUF3857)/Transglutaminase-like superfamily